MTSINRTAYPYFRTNQKVTSQELESYYSLTDEELCYVKQNIRGDELRLSFAVQLKVVQYLNYFPALRNIPEEIISHIKKQLTFVKQTTEFEYEHESTLNRHRKRIYDYLSITRWGNQINKAPGTPLNPARHYAIQVAYEAAETMNHPADIINVVIEELRKNNYELPSFNQLSRLIKHTRSLVNRRIFEGISQQLTPEQKKIFEDLLIVKLDYNRTGFNGLKQLPKKPSITHFRELIKHHHWLLSLVDTKKYLENISQSKLQQFAEQAKSLDADNLGDFSPDKRYALIICLIHRAQCRAKDALAITFCKTISKMHKKADAKFEVIKESSRDKTNKVVSVFSDVLAECKVEPRDPELLDKIFSKINDGGGVDSLHADCQQIIMNHSNGSLDFLWEYYVNKRPTLFRLLDALDLRSTTQNDVLIEAMKVIQDNESSKLEYLSIDMNLSFTTKQWRKIILKKHAGKMTINRRHLEMSVFSHLAEDLVSNDVFIDGADSFADYRARLLSHTACQEKMGEYCRSANLPNNAPDFMKFIKKNLIDTALRVDHTYPEIDELIIDEHNNPILKKREPKKRPASAIWLANEIKARMPERNIVDILCNAQHYSGWADVFGPISGSDPKIDNAIERYILTNFAYGSGMGPTQAARHIKSDITPHMLSWINRRHVTPKMLDKAREKLINFSNSFPLLSAWGDTTSCAGDGNLRELREENLIAEFHMRYGRKGGIAYHHVANNYILLFSTFIPCGVWEAVEIIEGLLKNQSELQPKKIHADTQGQSTIVFALAYLLGFKLMPRIRNWKDLKFFRPDKKTKYKHIDSLFNDSIRWDIIETHWEDMMQVVLSIKNGDISSSSLLRKLGSYSRKNKLYFALQELGRVIRTQFLLEYISDVELREVITETTNKMESYNGLSEWASFGSMTLVASNDEDEMEKAIKYNDILTSSIILQNIIDITETLIQLIAEGYDVRKEDVAFLSPYLTGHIKRFGDYYVHLEMIPKDINVNRSSVLW